jgi:hypothetical protein
MSYAIVHPKCYNKEGHCLHWVQSTVDDSPMLEFGVCDRGKQIQSDNSQLNNSCGNPWNHLSDDYSQMIKTECPEIQQPPTHGRRPVTRVTILENLTDLKSELTQDIASDCWSVYTRNASTHLVAHTYFFQPQSLQDQVEHTKREKLIDNPLKLIDDLNQGLQVCCSFGCHPFLDVYYQNVSQPNQTHRYIKISSIC